MSNPDVNERVESLAERHLGDSDDTPVELLNRLDNRMERLRKVEAYAASVAELLRRGVNSRSPGELLSDLQAI